MKSKSVESDQMESIKNTLKDIKTEIEEILKELK